MPTLIDVTDPLPGGGPTRRIRRHHSDPSFPLRRSSRVGQPKVSSHDGSSPIIDIPAPANDDDDSDVPGLHARDFRYGEDDDTIEAACVLHGLRAMDDASGALASPAAAATPPGECDFFFCV